ncbi:TM2 domain-containing protein [Paenarthrobacter nitroguajacolicus]|uniref:TM2 domain-containing protein n=1 Tax=Paenarthrobacter nitroguajacolicus TaxID=211146 RepID=UPI00142EE7FA|nr:TM2 domain-containing protein [Paenarthrobacter nitroguajacolicus]
MAQPHPDDHAAQPEGGQPPVPPQPQFHEQPQPPLPPQGYAQQPQQPYAHPQVPQQHYAAQPPALQQPQYYAQPRQPQYYAQPQQPQYGAQPPLPNPAYGYPQQKSKIAAGLLGIFLGGLGIHRFYLGYTTIGVIQLVLTIVVGIFTFGLIGLWGLIEGIMILAGAEYFRRDAQGVPLRD